MIRAIIFDADGPLYQRTSSTTQAKIALLHEFGYTGDYATFEHAYDIEKFKAYDQSETATTMFSTILSGLGTSMDSDQASTFTTRFNDIQTHISPAPDALDTLQKLAAKNYQVCILTDSFFPASEKRDWFGKLGMAPYIATIISSYDIRMLKSTKAAYQACLDAMHSEAVQTVFVGHQQYEMDGAKKADITSICLTAIAIPETTSGDYNIDSLRALPDLLETL